MRSSVTRIERRRFTGCKMNFGFDPNEAAGAANQITSAVGPMLWIMILLALGMLGRMVFVAWGDKMNISGWFQNASGVGLIGLALALFVGGIFITDRDVRAWVVIQQTVVDPVLVGVLKRDSCNPDNDRFCVVVWDDKGRELIVKWHDKRVDAHEAFGGYDYNLSVVESPRPILRPDHITTLAQVTVSDQ